MSINTLIEEDLQLIYDELYDDKALFKGKSIGVFYANDYDISSVREKVVTVQTKDVIGISNSDIFTINSIDYKVITFSLTSDAKETIIGLEK